MSQGEGCRSHSGGRMASWMLYRCVFGPHLQRIHRSPDQSRPEGRLTRRVRVDVFRAVLEQLNADTDFYIDFNRFGYICSSKLVPVSQYVGTVLVCLLGVACLRGTGPAGQED
ncbi:hypothetical protein GOODEAATRI_002953 [Goodea atripinnis]|uniref:Phosphatidylserine Lipase ABHD16 N-terminal domain-containing protein n=1 Tax=Goodea atripinnis TaxID=208336 RepID=A0ABV0MY86_9TELE